MKKLLLLTTLPLAAFLTSFTHKDPNAATRSLNDSTKVVATNPKAGFRDLFENTGAEGSFVNVKLNPKAISFVQDYMDANNTRLTNMKSWGRPYFDLIESVLSAHSLPAELKYLSVIESDLKTSAVSWAGAVGPWQLMPQTARELGLRVTRKVDERRDYQKSTGAAARYLNDLYNVFGDWLLVIAAYNTGPGNVNIAIRKSGSRNFWDLQNFLPAESRNHVKKFIATHYIMQGDGGVTTMTKTERADYQQGVPATDASGMEAQTISGKYNSGVIAQVLQIDGARFSQMNPNFDKQLSQNGSYELRLPSDKMAAFESNKNLILEQSVRMILNLASK